jgi:hypothetical protein
MNTKKDMIPVFETSFNTGHAGMNAVVFSLPIHQAG